MSKKMIWLLMVLVSCLSGASVADRQIIDPREISIKAGPTEPAEPVRLLWLESYVYPREVKDSRVISLGVRGTSKLKSVSASFDFSKNEVALTSPDNLNWSGVFEIPAAVTPGLHLARYEIKGNNGAIKRTVEFVVDSGASEQIEVSYGESIASKSWPLTIVATGQALVGGVAKLLRPGEKVVGVSKLPWYKIILTDGQEGWISTALVDEPLEEYYLKGYEAYLQDDCVTAIGFYSDCVAIDPNYVKGHFWLAKSYYKLGDLDSAYTSLFEAIRLDERNMEAKILADTLAQEFYTEAKDKFKAGRFNEAIAAYQKGLDLKPTSMAAWFELGSSYQKLALNDKALSTWRQALKYDPQNKQLLALVGADIQETVTVAQAGRTTLPAALQDDSLEIVRLATTNRGTKIETALKSVVSLTKSLGTPVVEKGWQTVKQGDKYLVRYLCEQGVGVVEAFEWLVDIDTKKLSASNDNARLLMNRW